MWKPILAATAAIAVLGTTLVAAQQRPDNPDRRWRPSLEDRAAFTDARIAALRAGLRLTPDQEKLWPAYEAALRDLAKSRAERAEARQSGPRPTDPVERLRRQADALTDMGTGLKRLADAQEPLYKSFDESQKNRFRMLASMLATRPMRLADRGYDRHHGDRGRHWHHRGGPGQQDQEGPDYRL